MNTKLYWHGNAAKVKIIDEILMRTAEARARGEVITIFEFGCGDAGAWPEILRDHPGFNWIGYEPGPNVAAARKRLEGFAARFLTDEEVETATIEADYIVSFSVFEHVYDRVAYLRNAKRMLARNGLFFLNYDDGHFRNTLEWERRATWRPSFSVFIHNLLAPFLARIGRVGDFQKRVPRTEMDTMVSGLGYSVRDEFYSNLGSLKAIARTIPPEQASDFSRMWVELEDRLNREFKNEGRTQRGDSVNLWVSMASRTLVLGH
jgi:SAM-dependent methyltransferase